MATNATGNHHKQVKLRYTDISMSKFINIANNSNRCFYVYEGIMCGRKI